MKHDGNAAKKLRAIPVKHEATDDNAALYQARQKIYPREIKGRFQRLRTLAVLVLLGLYYIIPWVNLDGRQAVLFDLPERKFYVLNLVFWPQDFVYLAAFLIICALSLFFFTALAGRMWCGYACPQTVWTEVYLWMERLTEGNRSKRMKLDAGPWNKEKILRKSAKQFLWIAFSLWTGFTFVGFFTPIRELAVAVVSFDLGPWETFWSLFYALATYGNAGFLREQVCIYMCPYARFQSSMFDKDTLIIAYDEKRGEPRGPRRRGEDYKAKGLGDCIDCTLCVQVCPTGIDIRDGLQYQCIACGACIDACNDVMDKVGYPRGLIRYTTHNAMAGTRTRILRPRIVVYAVLLIGITAAVFAHMLTRSPMDMNVLHHRNPLYRVLDGGRLENGYTLKIMNRDTIDRKFEVEVAGLPGMRIETDPALIMVPAGKVVDVTARVAVEREQMRGAGMDIQFILKTVDDDGREHLIREKGRFLGPVRR